MFDHANARGVVETSFHVLRVAQFDGTQILESLLKDSLLRPCQVQAREAMNLLWSARRPLVISGRGARGAGAELTRLLDACGALYLDTGESRGLVNEAHPSVVAAMRGSVMAEADVIVTLGRRLDFQLAYGSPAVFGQADRKSVV